MNSQELLQWQQFDVLVKDELGYKNGIKNIRKDEEESQVVDKFLNVNENG
jgi:hypothetical protein